MKKKKKNLIKKKKTSKKKKEDFIKEKEAFNNDKKALKKELFKIEKKDDFQIIFNDDEIKNDISQNKKPANLRYYDELNREIFDNAFQPTYYSEIKNKLKKKKINHISINANPNNKFLRPLTTENPHKSKNNKRIGLNNYNPDLIHDNNILNYYSEELDLQNEFINNLKNNSNIKIYNKNNNLYIEKKNGTIYQLNLEIKRKYNKNNYYKGRYNNNGQFYLNFANNENPQEYVEQYKKKELEELSKTIKREYQNTENYVKKQLEIQTIKKEEIRAKNIHYNNVLFIGNQKKIINNQIKKQMYMVREVNQNKRKEILSNKKFNNS